MALSEALVSCSFTARWSIGVSQVLGDGHAKYVVPTQPTIPKLGYERLHLVTIEPSESRVIVQKQFTKGNDDMSIAPSYAGVTALFVVLL